jgi:hypothetical protein
MPVSIKLLPFSVSGTVAIDTVTAVTITPVNRAAAPYPPGNIRVGGYRWPNGVNLPSVASLTWAHRIRTAQDGLSVVQQDAASTAGTVEGTYTVEVLIAGTVKRTVTGLTGAFFNYYDSMRAADDADLTKIVQFRITPVSGTKVGAARTTDSFTMHP